MERLIQKIEPSVDISHKLRNVAAYARVSSGKDAMLHSLSAQVGYYSELIQSNPEWRFCGVFADEAITGTKESRPEFQKMLAECRKGKIDLIITKSISRFARNTITVLETVRELKILGIDVYFQEQNIHSISADGELMLSILSSYAQEESFSASENQKWRIRNDFEQGKICNIRMLGYRRTTSGSLEIVESEAEIVRFIFLNYLSGNGKLLISNKLNEMGIATINGCEWTTADIHRILQNEKYAGNMLLQKRFRENHLTKRMIRNDGQLPKYFVEESHPAIIEKSIFDAVQKKLEEQHQRFSTSKSVASYPFTGKIQCTCCGKNYRHKITATGNVWICATYNTRGKKYCPTAKQIPESTLISVCCEILSIAEFDANIFENQVEKILVPAPNKLIVQLKNGKCINTTWKDRSRSESWTEEKRAAAAKSSKTRRWRKCQK